MCQSRLLPHPQALPVIKTKGHREGEKPILHHSCGFVFLGTRLGYRAGQADEMFLKAVHA